MIQEWLDGLARLAAPSGAVTPFGKVPWDAAAIRMGAALIFGGVIGWERELHRRQAGLRTHMLLSLAACLFALVAFDLMTIEGAGEENLRLDPIRLVEAVTAGVAFLAAGTIILQGDRVRGLTTGAGMWLAGAVGLACGVGNLALAGMAVVLALIVLALLRLLPESVSRPHDDPPGDDE